MNSKITKVTTPKGLVRYEARVWGRGRAANEVKKRFKTRALASDFVDGVEREAKEFGEDTLGRSFGDEYQFWRAHETFSPGWSKNLDGYWGELKELLDKKNVANITPEFLKRLAATLRAKKNSEKTINNKVGFIVAVLNYSLEVGRITKNPTLGYKKIKPPEVDIDFWEMDEARSFFAFLDEQEIEPWRKLACLTAVNTGIRAGELWALQPAWIKRQSSILRVMGQYNRVSKEFTHTKGKRNRNVPLNAMLLSEFDRHGVFEMKPQDFVFRVNGEPVDHDVFGEWFSEQVELWGGKRITFHGLRHTAATNMLAAGVDIKTVREIMGHRSTETTMKYLHLLSPNVARAAELYSVSGQSSSEGSR